MSKPEKRYWYVVRRAALDELPVPGVLDMLRYDAARVEPNAPDGFYLLSKRQEGGYAPPAAARWESFGIRIVTVSIGTYPPEPAECVRAAEADARMNPRKGGVR